MESSQDGLQTAPIHRSLQRRPTMGGLPQDAFLLLLLILITMCIASRLDPKVLIGSTIAYLTLLPLLRKAFDKDPFLMMILPRTFRYRSHYSRQQQEHATLWRDRVQKPR
ncbi:MAG: VirB3 family type IV secretion system protein [Bacteroidetes bacterium]|nr:VirB3 family type IV secretion system protein [Bacteroidota bacterium]